MTRSAVAAALALSIAAAGLAPALNAQAAPPAAPAAPAAAADTAPPKPAPFSYSTWAWLNGNSRDTTPVVQTPYFDMEFRADINFIEDLNHPSDHTLDGAAEAGRTSEIQLQQLGIGGDLHYKHVRGRLMTQFGMYSELTPRNDASPQRGQWQLDNAYRYISEAYGGYHWDKWYGINLDAGIFMSYVGLFSYYNFDNWAYQPSYVSANTPWFFQGLRLQIFPTDRFKAEFWLVDGWQSYGMFNHQPGVGFQLLWRPDPNWSLLTNDYYGHDTFNTPDRFRIHTDNSVQYRYFDNPKQFVDRGAFTFTFDLGCEGGGGVECSSSTPTAPAQYFLGFMVYNRLWFAKDQFAVTVGGGAINNPGRYLVLLPPINGATAASGTPYFTESPGDQYKAWDGSLTFDYMPDDHITFRAEYDHRWANVPYFVGPGGITPAGGNTGSPGSTVTGFTPSLVQSENRFNMAIMVKL
jgi:hypothetical protein